MSNDVKIEQYRKTIEEKRIELGEKPRAHYTTNALLKLPEAGLTCNLNLLNTIPACVDITQQLLMHTQFRDKANELLGTNVPYVIGNYTVEQWVADIKIRVSIIEWEAGNKKLQAMDKKLADLRSNDAKTADAIGDIAKELDL